MLKMLEQCNPEIKLLLCCAQSSLDAESSRRLKKLLQENLDWDYLLLMGRRHKLMPLLYWHLNQTGEEIVPPQIWLQLQEYFDRKLQRNQLLTTELFNLLNLFEFIRNTQSVASQTMLLYSGDHHQEDNE